MIRIRAASGLIRDTKTGRLYSEVVTDDRNTARYVPDEEAAEVVTDTVVRGTLEERMSAMEDIIDAQNEALEEMGVLA